jgi:uncharacterized protein (DUF2147 family)
MMRFFYLFFCFALFFTHSIYAGNSDSPIGYWQTIDDLTGETKSIVHITQVDAELTGKVVKLFHDPAKRCTHCIGAQKNAPILGMVIMEGLSKDKDNARLWSKGSIIDPKSGKVYHCNIQMLGNGQKLLVRGYFGIPLFGRSQTWVRASEA